MVLHGLLDLELAVPQRTDLVAIGDRLDVPGPATGVGHKWVDGCRSGAVGQSRRSVPSVSPVGQSRRSVPSVGLVGQVQPLLLGPIELVLDLS
jgi:hypothetical protein